MSQKDTNHRVVSDPVESGLSIDLRCVVDSKEAIAIQSARCCQNKYAECSITEAEALRGLLCKQSYLEIHIFKLAIVNQFGQSSFSSISISKSG